MFYEMSSKKFEILFLFQINKHEEDILEQIKKQGEDISDKKENEGINEVCTKLLVISRAN